MSSKNKRTQSFKALIDTHDDTSCINSSGVTALCVCLTYVCLNTAGEQVTTGDRWFKAFIIDCIKWVIDRLNTISRDYRTVAMRLDKDQVKEKKKEMVGRKVFRLNL